MLKIKTDHYRIIKESIRDFVDIPALRQATILHGQYKDLEKRIRWDALHKVLTSQWICDNLYPYMNDDHIDSALKAIIKELS